MKDYYNILGVKKDAAENELKKAYKKRAIKLHPDKNPAPQAKEAFQRVGQAMATLEDKEKRNLYDQLGPEAYEARENQGGLGMPVFKKPETFCQWVQCICCFCCIFWCCLYIQCCIKCLQCFGCAKPLDKYMKKKFEEPQFKYDPNAPEPDIEMQ